MFTCAQCAQPFGLKPYEVKRRTIHCGYAPRFCSVKCHLDHKRANPGAASQYWTGRNGHYRGPGWRVLRLKVIEAQNGCCKECGEHRGTALHVHHVQRFKTYETPAQANARGNLVGLCRKCHGKADSRPDAFRRYNDARRVLKSA